MSEQKAKAAAWYEVGFAQKQITPPLGTSLAGFFHNRVATWVRDDLYARAMVVGQGGERVAIVGLDLICVDSLFVEAARQLITQETGIAGENVLISASHTHTGPEVRQVGNKVPRNEAWLATLPRMIADAVAEANGRLTRATLRAGQINTENYAFNRLYRRRDGMEQMGRKGIHEGELLGPAAPIDMALQTLGAVDESGKLLGMIVNLGMHPVTVAGAKADFISADWPGEMAKNIQAVYGPDTVPIYLQGACGDINHTPYDDSLLPQTGPQKTIQLGRGLAGAAIYAHERAEPMTTERLTVVVDSCEVPYYTRTPEIFAEIAALKAKGELDAAQAYFVTATETWPFDNQICHVPLQVLAIGDLALAAIPAQVFSQIGQNIKRWSPAKQTMVIELANSRVTSYVPTADQVERGAYGSRPIVSRWLSPDTGRRMADSFLVMLQRAWAQQPATTNV